MGSHYSVVLLGFHLLVGHQQRPVLMVADQKAVPGYMVDYHTVHID